MSNTFYVPAADEVQQAKASQAPRRKVAINGVRGELETPSGKDPFQNAWLNAYPRIRPALSG
jgi:hypothetical protein